MILNLVGVAIMLFLFSVVGVAIARDLIDYRKYEREIEDRIWRRKQK